MSIQTTISLFSNIKQVANGKEIPFDIFLDQIKDGAWQDIVLPIRAIKDEKERTEAKKNVPYVTISGRFSERTDAKLIAHSNFIGIDIDDVDPEKVKTTLSTDRYVHAAFTSISGSGVCAIIKINGDKHREAFAAICEYLYEKYQIITDPTSVNISRPRFISFDPHLYYNQHSEKFTAIPKKKAEHKVPEVIYVQSDFDLLIQEIQSRKIDITGGYDQWLRIGFALAEKFGEQGRTYYHQVSCFSQLYTTALCDKQYTNCLKARKSGVTIATLYYHAKQAGINTQSEKTKLIAQTAMFAKKQRRSQEDTVKLLQESEGISAKDSTDIIAQVFDNNIKVETKDSPIDDLELYLRQNYELRRNVITRYIENHGRPMEKRHMNTMYIAAKKLFDKLSYELLERLVMSEFTPDYNPLLDFFETHKARKPKGVIEQLFNCIETDTGFGDGEFYPQYKQVFGLKWIVGIISAVHGVHSPLLLVLSGELQGTGKTEFFRRLLPQELRKYYAESKLDRGKDDEILMTQKLIVMDDELSGKSKKEITLLKDLTSKQVFSLREPYGANNVDLNRIAVLCGTTNTQQILNDPTGNRRIIPINVISINHEAYNKIDKIDLLMEAYWLWKDGFKWELTREDAKILSQHTSDFQEAAPELELLQKYFSPEVDINEGSFMTTTEIKSVLEIRSNQKLNINKLGQELKRCGYERYMKRNDSKIPVYGYNVHKKFLE